MASTRRPIIVLASTQVPDLGPSSLYVSRLCPGKQVDLNTGLALDGTAPTDFGPCIHRLLAGASAAHPVLVVLDGSFAVSGVYGPLAGNWSLTGLGGGMRGNRLYGTGLFQLAGTNGDVIHNGSKHQYEPGQAGAPTTRGANVTIRNFVMNGNRGNGTDGNNTSGDPRRQAGGADFPWTMGIALHSLNHVVVDDVYTYNIASFNVVLDNVGDAEVNGDTFANTGATGSVELGQNGDGLHIDGPANDIRSTNVVCRATDDCFALNAPEGALGGGLIERVSLSNWTMDARTCGRMYTNSTRASAAIHNVNISRVDCKSRSWPVMFGEADGTPHTLTMPNSITDVTVSDSTFSSPFGFIVSDSIGDLTIANTTVSGMTCTHDGLSQPYCGFLQTATNRDITIRHLVLRNDTLQFTPDGHAAVAGAVNTLNGWNAGSGNRNSTELSVQTLEISGFRKVDQGGSFGPIGQLITTDRQTTIQHLIQDGNDFSNIAAVTNAPQSILVGGEASQVTQTEAAFDPLKSTAFTMTRNATISAGSPFESVVVTNATGQDLTLTPAPGTTINESSAAVRIAPHGRETLLQNPMSPTDWIVLTGAD